MKDLPKIVRDRKIEGEKRKRIIAALRIVLALKINCSTIHLLGYSVHQVLSVFFCVCSSFKSLLSVNPFVRSLSLSPTLYKFIVLGSLGSYPRSFGLGLRIVTLQTILKFFWHYFYWKYKKNYQQNLLLYHFSRKYF